MHVFNPENNTWKTLIAEILKFNKANPFFLKAGAAHALVGNQLYCFGGKESKGKI